MITQIFGICGLRGSPEHGSLTYHHVCGGTPGVLAGDQSRKTCGCGYACTCSCQRDGNTLTIVDLSFASSPSERIRVRLRHLAEGLAKLPLGLARAAVYGIQDGRSGVLRGLKTSVIGFGQLKAVAGKDVLGYHVTDSDPN